MPDILIRVTNIAALDEVDVFEEIRRWKFRKCPYPRGLYTFLLRSDGAAGGMQHEIKIGTTEVVQLSDTAVGLADGFMPTPAGASATPAHQFYATQGDEVTLTLFETGNVATSDVMIWCNVEPA